MHFIKQTCFSSTFFAIVLFCLSSVSSEAAFRTVKMRGQQYVSVNAIKSAYQFTNYSISGNTANLSKRGVKLDFKANSSYVTINTLKFVFSYPIIKSGSGMYISETDTIKVLDPIMKPANISGVKSFRNVIIDAGHGGKDAGAVNRYGTERCFFEFERTCGFS